MRTDDLDTPRFLSLRWKALIALSLILLVVNASLALLAYRQSVGQFELQQANVHGQQSRQLRALLEDGFESMSKLSSFILPMETDSRSEDLSAHLHRALELRGSMLNLEWGVDSIHLLGPAGQTSLSWPAMIPPPPAELTSRLSSPIEETVHMLLCRPECFQYLARPVLWDGRSAGTLVLSRSVADAILAFKARTGADVAILTDLTPGIEPRSPEHTLDSLGLAIPAITNPQITLPLIKHAESAGLLSETGQSAALMQVGDQWYEIFRLDPPLADGVQTLVINQVTAQQQAIHDATRNSILIGILGLVLSETLLMVVLHTPVSRIRRLVAELPLLAENRFQELRERLPMMRRRFLSSSDEIDTMVGTVSRLTNRMEELRRRRKEAEERLVWLADHDPLTHLFNRRRFTEDFDQIINRSLRYDHTGALLFFDLDQFKDVNDLSGHNAGDNLLRHVAERLQSLLRGTDLLGRLGGDEFALVLPESNTQHAIMVADRVQDLIQDIVLTVRKHRHRVSASIGIVLFPEHGRDSHNLLANADLAMYQAKEKGRGRRHMYSVEDQAREKVDARVIWMDQIDQALKNDRFELHFQPIVDLSTGKMRHAEALIRMRDADGRLIFPGSFIPIAEKTGRIQSIDHWVLTRAIETMARNPGLCLSVNLSGNAMDDDTLLPTLEDLLDKHRITSECLTFELTETVAVNSLLTATRLMRRIQDLGCRFALDDFGSGFASYAYLRRLPVDDIKIDGEFVRGLADGESDRIFVKAISDVAHSVHKGVIAEFVENEAILKVLVELGIEYAQGYHLGRPMQEQDLMKRLQAPPFALPELGPRSEPIVDSLT